MRRIILISFLFISFLAKAQQYTNFQGYGFKANRLWADSVSIQPSDTVKNKVAKSIAILNNKLYVADGTKWIIAGGGAVDTFLLSTRAWRQKGIDSVVSLINAITPDTFTLSTRAWRQKGIDSVSANVNFRVKYTDTALMLLPYLRKADTISLSNRIDARVKYTDTASMLSPYSKLKSVGLTMPSAFNVTNSPLTSNGTISVSGAGTTSQYIRGDGQLASFPTSSAGGGASVSYYLNGSVNKGTFGGQTYYEMSRTAIIGAGTDFTRTNAQGDGLIAQFITDTITNLLIPSGNWNLELYFNASSGGGTPSFYVELYKYNGTTFTLISSNSTSPELIAFGTTINPYFSALAVPETILSGTDRLALRVFVTTSGRTINLHTENSHLCQIITTFTTGLTAINGLTKQVQYFATGTSGTDFNISSSNDTHTFNLPTASATNTGKLSSANWTTFNNKLSLSDTLTISTRAWRQKGLDSLAAIELNVADTSTMLNPYTRGSGTSGQVAYWNDTRSLTGSSGFTFTPTSSLLVNNSVTAASAIARGTNLTPTLVAAANSDVLVGLDINPTFTNGAFTGVNNLILRGTIGSTKTSTAGSHILFFRTNDAIQQQSLLVSYIGNSSNFLRSFTFNTAEEGISYLGNITFQNLGGRVLIGSNTVLNSSNVFEVTGSSRFTSTILGTIGNFTTSLNVTNSFDTDISLTTTSSGAAQKYGIIQSTVTNRALALNPTNGGNVLINQTTDAGFRLDVNGTARVQGNSRLNGNISTLNALPTTLSSVNHYSFLGSASVIQGVNSTSNINLGIRTNSYFNGTNQIYIQNGRASSLYFDDDASLNYFIAPSGTGGNSFSFTQLFKVFNTGNFAIGTTTDAGFRLDVNGTARVNGNLTAPLVWAGNNATTVIYSDDAAGSQNGISLIRSNRTGLGNQSIVNFTYQTTEVARFTTSGILAINTTTPNASSIVDITSTTRGFLPPRMTTAQRDLIATPAAGLVIYNTSTNKHQGYNGTTWNDFY